LKRLRWAVAVLLASTIFLLNGCSSSTTNIPTPSIGTISPDSVTAGSEAFTLFISGTGFETNTVGFLDGTSRPSKFNMVTGQIEMSITAADVAVADSSAQVTVANPLPGGTSNALTLVVNPVANGAPTITGFNPPSATAGTMGPFAVSVAGTGFVQTSVVNWNGSPRATTFVSSSQLMVNFTTQDLATAGSGSVSVSNPAPGGGVSPSKNFPVN
jgi:trimeric autotransporter adhesin